MRFKGVWPTAPRDFLVLTTSYESTDGSIVINSKSAPDDFCPPNPSEIFVRGNIVVSGYEIKPNKESRKECMLTLIAHTELGGTLPASIINMLSATAPFKMLLAIRDMMSS